MPDKDLPARIDALDFATEKSMRYHQRRRGFFESLHSGAMFIVILSGSAAFARFSGQSQLFGLVAAVTAAADLTVGFSRKARDHELLHSKFTDLAIEIRETDQPSEDEYRRWCRKRVEIEKNEPPIYWALEGSCHNEVVDAWGRNKAHRVKIPRLQRVLMNWARFDRQRLYPEEQSA